MKSTTKKCADCGYDLEAESNETICDECRYQLDDGDPEPDFNCLAALIGFILAAITVMAILIYRYGL